jgi:hypothetical protein
VSTVEAQAKARKLLGNESYERAFQNGRADALRILAAAKAAKAAP